MSYLFTMSVLHFMQNKRAFFMNLLVLLFIVLITKVTSWPVADGDGGYSIGGDVDELTSADGSGAGNSGTDGSGSDGGQSKHMGNDWHFSNREIDTAKPKHTQWIKVHSNISCVT